MAIKKIGILVDNIGCSDFGLQLISNINTICSDINFGVTIFINQYVIPPINPYFSILHHVEAYSYDGILISTTPETLNVSLKCFTTAKRFHYIWDFQYKDSYILNRDIYSNDRVKYITRSVRHFELLNNIWGKTSKIIEEWNNESIRTLFE